MQPDVIILLGPSGAGKTTIGRFLEHHFACVFLSLEEFFLTRYPSYEQYRSHREDAYHLFEHLVYDTLQTSGKPVVFEEVGLSSISQMLIGNVQQHCHTVLVQVMAEEALCMHRVVTRSTSSNFPKTPETVQRVHRQYLAEAPARYTFALEIENEDVSEEELYHQLSVLFHR
jgi:shikimate kinase